MRKTWGRIWHQNGKLDPDPDPDPDNKSSKRCRSTTLHISVTL